jgi:cell division septum initiation protein DivIVA
VEAARQESGRLIAEAQKKINEFYAQATQQKDAAQMDAQRLIEDARMEISLMRDELERERAKAYEELNMMNQQKIQFQAAFKALIDTQLKLIENDPEQS